MKIRDFLYKAYDCLCVCINWIKIKIYAFAIWMSEAKQDWDEVRKKR